MTYRERALQIAISQIGVCEHPADSNSGDKVRQYQAATALGGTGWPWCAAFVNWCFREAGLPLDKLNRSASVGELLALARKLGWVVSTPRAGDIVCFDWNTLNGPGHGDWPDHVGIVRRVFSGGRFEAVEGNTAVGNNSNGGKVMSRADRSMAMVEGFIRVPGEIPPRFVVKAGGKVRHKSVTGAWLASHGTRLSALARKFKGVSIRKKR
jgi:hypothetical protein